MLAACVWGTRAPLRAAAPSARALLALAPSRSYQAFFDAQAFARGEPAELSHAQRVTRLYRRALRVMDSWACDRGIFLEQAEAIRARFDAQKTADLGVMVKLLREGEEELATWTHPDMYTVPYMPGGSKFMRNAPLPLEAVFPHGIPPEYNIVCKDVNGIQVPMSATPQGMQKVIIDFSTKQATSGA